MPLPRTLTPPWSLVPDTVSASCGSYVQKFIQAMGPFKLLDFVGLGKLL